MKSKKNLVLIFLAILIVVRIIIVLIEQKKAQEIVTPADSTVVKMTHVNPDANLSKTPDEAVISRNDTDKLSLCQSMRERYQDLNSVKKLEKTSVRFVNIHKKIDGVVYRTRFFYKDSNENEIPTYLAYKENSSDEEILIESTAYKKGPEYLKIEKSTGPVIYTEEGVNIGVEQDLFLHYENKELKDLQGTSPLPEEKDFIDCRF